MQCCRFAECIASPIRILGLALQPFSLGHHLILKRLESACCENPGASLSESDLLIAAAICGHNYREGLSLLRDDDLALFVQKWRRSLGYRARKRLDIAGATKLFASYLSAGYSRPKIWKRRGNDGITLSAPWEEILKVRLVMAGFAESEVMDKFLPLAWFDYYTVTELQSAQLLTDTKHWRKLFFTEEDEALFAARAAEGSSDG